MPLPRGRTIPLHRGRRIVSDILHFSQSVPMVAIDREVTIPEVALARDTADPKPGWYPVLLKAFAIAATAVPDLRRSLLTSPYPRLYEHACSVATVTVEREVDGVSSVLFFLIRQPESTPLGEIDARFKRIKTAPLQEIADFRRLLLLMRFPRLIRRFLWWLALRTSGSWRQKYCGTFGVTSVLSAGATVHIPPCPLTSTFTFGQVKQDGSVLIRLSFDHRVLDGVAAARGLVEVEKALRGPILSELRALARVRRLAV